MCEITTYIGLTLVKRFCRFSLCCNVARKEDDRSKKWVNERALAGTLCKDLLSANKILKYGSYEDLHVFNGNDFLMNSILCVCLAFVVLISSFLIGFHVFLL